MQLYKLTEQYRILTDLAFESADDETGALEQDFVGVLSSLTDDIDTKLSQLCRVVRELEQAEAAAKNEAAFLAKKSRAASNAVDRLKSYMKDNLQAIGETKRKVDSVFTVAIQANPPGLDVYDLNAVPTDYDLPSERRVDSARIKGLLKAGSPVPGCCLTNGTHLRIR